MAARGPGSVQVRAGALTGAVLTGGRSLRMGRDKALLEVDGRPLAFVVAAALRDAGADPVLAVGGDGHTRVALGRLGLQSVEDDHPGTGPLGGVATALRHAPGELVAVLACDLPDVTGEGIELTSSALAAAPGAGAAVPVVGGRREPLHAVWRRSALPVVTAALDRGERAVHRVLAALGAVPVDGLDPRWVRNVNVPGDLGHTGRMSQEPDVPAIDVAELARRHHQGVFVLDVRQPDEYESGHVPGAVLLPLDQLGTRHEEVPRDGGEVFVICRTGARSAVAVEALNGAGYTATNVSGGTKDWIAAGHPVVVGPDPA